MAPINMDKRRRTLTMVLTKSHLIETIAEKNGFTREKSIETVETFLEIIKSTLSSGDDVLITGFGKFYVKEKRDRRGRNPAIGEDLILAPRRVVTFKCSGKLTDRINGEENMNK
jgi:integration host factor subunit alpha